MDGTRISTELLQFIRDEFAAGRAVGEGDPLLRGIIDSIGIFTMVGFIENTFHVSIQDRELTVENFATVQTLTRLIQAKLDAKEDGR